MSWGVRRRARSGVALAASRAMHSMATAAKMRAAASTWASDSAGAWAASQR
ncbi:MAG TPA: hypothetical protein VK585_03495 [Jiangellaceae bacterium]|nr:hypothetical protein [Jiangellaceae bacterium]